MPPANLHLRFTGSLVPAAIQTAALGHTGVATRSYTASRTHTVSRTNSNTHIHQSAATQHHLRNSSRTVASCHSAIEHHINHRSIQEDQTKITETTHMIFERYSYMPSGYLQDVNNTRTSRAAGQHATGTQLLMIPIH